MKTILLFIVLDLPVLTSEVHRILWRFGRSQTFPDKHKISVSAPKVWNTLPLQAITITLHFQKLSKDTLLPVSLSCYLASIHQRALILSIQTLTLYKSCTYLLSVWASSSLCCGFVTIRVKIVQAYLLVLLLPHPRRKRPKSLITDKNLPKSPNQNHKRWVTKITK